MDKHCVNEISFTNNFCFFLNLPVNNELGIVQDGRHEFIIKCFKPSQNHYSLEKLGQAVFTVNMGKTFPG